MTDPDFRELGARLSNWGRWGAEDERGTLNHITPADLIAAAGLVKTGEGVRPRHPVRFGRPAGARQQPDQPGPAGVGDRPRATAPDDVHFTDDYVFMPLPAASQWDALAHIYYDGSMYNGFPSDTITGRGAAHCSIDKIGKGVAGRGSAAGHRPVAGPATG